MRFVLTALAMIGGIVFTLIGLGFFFQPDSTGANFALLPDGDGGRYAAGEPALAARGRRRRALTRSMSARGTSASPAP